MKGLVPRIYRPLLWMMPGFAFTIFSYWYPEWLDRRIPMESDSRIWMIVGLLINYTFVASMTVVVAYVFVLIAAVQRKGVHAIIAMAVGLLAFVPSAWLTYTTVATWIQLRQEIRTNLL